MPRRQNSELLHSLRRDGAVFFVVRRLACMSNRTVTDDILVWLLCVTGVGWYVLLVCSARNLHVNVTVLAGLRTVNLILNIVLPPAEVWVVVLYVPLCPVSVPIAY